MTSPRFGNAIEAGPAPIRFGAYSISPANGELRKDGMPVHLPRQTSQLLLLLLEQPGRIRSRDELKRLLWAEESYGDFDHGLNKAVYSLRAALGDLARNPRLVETLSGRGYRFIGTVEMDGSAARVERPWPEVPLAVMPFAVASGELNWISIEIATRVIDELSCAEGLKVLAFNQVRSLLTRENVQMMRETFGVRAMIVGDLKGEGEELYVHAEMVDCVDGTQMWGVNARLPLRRRETVERIADGIVSRVKTARMRETGQVDQNAGEALWSRIGRVLRGEWRGIGRRAGWQ